MKSNFYTFFSLWIIMVPFLGIPGVWKNALVSLSGLFLLLVISGPSILKKLETKPKTKKKQNKTPIEKEEYVPLPEEKEKRLL